MAKKKAKAKKNTSKKNLSRGQVGKKPGLRITRYHKVVMGSFLMLLGLGLLIAFTSFLFNWKADQSALSQLGERSVQAENQLSKFGAAVSDFFIYDGFGIAAFNIGFLVLLTGIYLFFDFKSKRLWGFW